MAKDNASAVVFGKMKEDLDTVKGDVDGLKQRVGVLEEQPSGGRSSFTTVGSNSLYSTVRNALKDLLTERDKAREEEGNSSLGDAILQREDQWVLRATSIANAFAQIQKSEANIESKLTNIETSTKTGKKTVNVGNSTIEITPFQQVQLTFKCFFQKSFMFDPRVIIMNVFIVTLMSAVVNLSFKVSALQDTKQKYEIMRHFYRKHEVVSSNFMFLDTLFLEKDKNEELIKKLKKQE